MVLKIERVHTRSQLTNFIALPRRIYSGMPGYVAPLDHERRQMLDPRKGAFFTHGEVAYWTATRDGRPVGRISAQIDFAANSPDADNVGLFGCLDAVDDSECVAGLLHTAEAWLYERGRRIARGPFLLSINGEAGLLVEGQLLPPIILLPWHPVYLDGLVRAAGYDSVTSLYCYECTKEEFEFDENLQDMAKIAARGDIAIRNLRLDNIDADMEVARCIFNDGWQGNWGFTPATESDVRALSAQFKPFLFSDTAFFVDVRGEPAAFVIAIPNVFEITADLGPRPSVLGWAKLVFRIWRKRYRCFRVVLLGMISKYQNSALGAAAAVALFDELRRRLRARHVSECVLGWVVETNHLPLKALRSMGFRQTRAYSLYERRLVN